MSDPKSMTEVEADKEAGRRTPEQTGEGSGRIKQAQHNPEKNLPRGSEAETHARK